MSMKSATAPRQIYVRNAITHVCFEGKFFGPTGGETKLSLEHPVTIEKAASDGGRSRITVTQKRKGQKTMNETWRSVTVPRKARG